MIKDFKYGKKVSIPMTFTKETWGTILKAFKNSTTISKKHD